MESEFKSTLLSTKLRGKTFQRHQQFELTFYGVKEVMEKKIIGKSYSFDVESFYFSFVTSINPKNKKMH